MTNEEQAVEYLGACPAWCTDCNREHAADGHVVHQGPTYVTPVHTENDGQLLATVQITHFDQEPAPRQTPPTDLDRPVIDISVEKNFALLRLTPTQARQLADLLTTLATDLESPAAT
jgi:hypothetical protein